MISRKANGASALALNGRKVWSGETSAGGGAVGLWVDSYSHLSVDRFVIAGESQPGALSFLYTEGLLGAGQSQKNWIEQKDSKFRFGIGAVREDSAGRAKWNFVGSGFTLWSPKGPDYGIAEIVVDGAAVATVDLYTAQPLSSQPVFSKSGLADTFHAVTLQPRKGRLVVDSLEVSSR